MVKINMISVKKLIEYISMESIIKKRIVIRLDENKSLTEIPEGIAVVVLAVVGAVFTVK